MNNNQFVEEIRTELRALRNNILALDNELSGLMVTAVELEKKLQSFEYENYAVVCKKASAVSPIIEVL